MASMPDTLTSELETILSATLGQRPRITGLRRLTGGTSHESWAFDAETPAGKRPLVIRRDFSAEQLDLGLTGELALLRALHIAGLPVPRPVAGGDDYIISERFNAGDIRKAMARDECDCGTLGVALVAIQAQLHGFDWAAGLSHVLAPRDEVAHWTHTAAEYARHPDPLLAATIAWLRANAPTDAPRCLIHGDFKTNNLVAGENGRLAIIDWELAHIGDPLEDLAWTMLWQTPHDLVGGMLTPDDYLAAYQRATGIPIDRSRLAYWQLFVLMKLMAIFARSLQLDAGSGHPRPTHIMLDRAKPWLHRQMADRLRAACTATQAA